MSDVRSEFEVDSHLVETWWDLHVQLRSRTDSPRETIIFAMGIATAFLTFVAATVSLMYSISLWWASVGLFAVGIAVLVFAWSVAGRVIVANATA